MTEKMLTDPYRKRLLYRAMHRGFKEADIVIGQFAQENLVSMTEAQIAEFEALLEVPDQDLFAWIIGRIETPANYEGEVMAMLRNYSVAAKLARDAQG